MFHQPMTKTEAEKYRYGTWAGEPKGRAYQPNYCAAEVSDSLMIFHQCGHRPGKGPDGLYCGVHAKRVTK